MSFPLLSDVWGDPVFECPWDNECTKMLAYAQGIVLADLSCPFPRIFLKGSKEFTTIHTDLANAYNISHDVKMPMSGPFQDCRSWEKHVPEESFSLVQATPDNPPPVNVLSRVYEIEHSAQCNALRDVLLLWEGVDKYVNQ